MRFSRRIFISGMALLGCGDLRADEKKKNSYRLRTAGLDIEMTIEFYDHYASQGFWFRNEHSEKGFCLSVTGEAGKDCMKNFRGSLAIARYAVHANNKNPDFRVLRERVRMIDRDERLADRAPFERSIELNKGIGSDLQVFGYEMRPGEEPTPDSHGPWCLYRQDLFLGQQQTPFLVVYWKHALSSIRVLDLIPGEQTWAVEE